MKTVILAAGFGSRLWPLSTSERPKQFQNFINNRSLLQHTYELLSKVTPEDELYVITLSGLEYLVNEQLPNIKPTNVILVPERRNTLPHTAYALSQLKLEDDEPVLFGPVDHYLVDPDLFVTNLREVIKSTPKNLTETYLLGTKAHTIDKSLGYIQAGQAGNVTNFIEKPDADAIATLEAADNVYINTLRYITSKAAFITLLDGVNDASSQQIKQFITGTNAERTQNFLALPSLDISHGLFEKSLGLKIRSVASDFIDIGKFNTLYDINDKDDRDNAIVGNVVLGENCSGNFVINQLTQPLVLINTQNSVVIQGNQGSVVSPMQDADTIGSIYKSMIRQPG